MATETITTTAPTTTGPTTTGTVTPDVLDRVRRWADVATTRTADAAVSADDVAAEMLLRIFHGETATLTMARRIVADVHRTATARTDRERASTGHGVRRGRVRRVSRSVAYFAAVQRARMIVDRGPALVVPVAGPGAVLARVVDTRSVRWCTRTGTGRTRATLYVRDAVRHVTVQRGRWTMAPLYGVRMPVPTADGPAVRFATVVQAILADGTTTRPDPDAARWSATRDHGTGKGLRSVRETTVAVSRFPDRTVTTVTAETTAAHQIRHGADHGPVRLIRESTLVRLLDKRSLYAVRTDADTAAHIPRETTPSADGVTYRVMATAFMAYRWTGGRGPDRELMDALDRAGTTIGVLISGHVHQDGDGAVPAVRVVAALREVGLPTTTTYQDTVSRAVRAAVRSARDAADRTGVPAITDRTVTFRPTGLLPVPARPTGPGPVG